MRTTLRSSLPPHTLRTTICATSATVFLLSLGFGPTPALYWLLSVTAAVFCITTATDLRGAKSQRSKLPQVLSTVIPALCILIFRETSLVWVVTPMLTFVAATAVWAAATNRHHEIAAPQTTTPASDNGTVPRIISVEAITPEPDNKAA